MFAGVIVEKSSVKREIKDSPAITFCALNEDNVGWKNTVGTWVQYGAWVDMYCANKTTVKDATACLDKASFNLSETVEKRLYTLDISKTMWTEDVTTTHRGKVLESACS